MKKILVISFTLGLFLHDLTALTHSLKMFYTGSPGLTNSPEFVVYRMVNDFLIDYYDSDTERNVPKQDWMSTKEGKFYWEWETQKRKGVHQIYKGNFETANQLFNKSGGVQVFQAMEGCEWDDETNKTKGYDQFGFDGEDFIAFDYERQTYVTARQEAVATKQAWDINKAWTARTNHYGECIDRLKTFLDYGKSSLMRKVLPSVSLLQKSPSSPITCHATGFYPNSAVLFWRKDGKTLSSNRKILPNHDGSFQMSVELLKLPPEDWGKYECVFNLSGVKEEMITKLEKNLIRTNYKNNTKMIIGIVVAFVLTLLVVAAVAGFKIWKDQKSKSDGACENSSGLKESLGMLITHSKDCVFVPVGDGR